MIVLMYFANVFAIPVSWSGFWKGFEHVNQVFMPIGVIATTALPFIYNMDGYRADEKMIATITQNGGKYYIQRVNGENFAFIEDPFGSIVRRSLRTGVYWFTYNPHKENTDYYYNVDHKKWVNKKTNVSFEDEHPGVMEIAQKRQAQLISNLVQSKQASQNIQSPIPAANGPPAQTVKTYPKPSPNPKISEPSIPVAHTTSMKASNITRTPVLNPNSTIQNKAIPSPQHQTTVQNPTTQLTPVQNQSAQQSPSSTSRQFVSGNQIPPISTQQTPKH